MRTATPGQGAAIKETHGQPTQESQTGKDADRSWSPIPRDSPSPCCFAVVPLLQEQTTWCTVSPLRSDPSPVRPLSALCGCVGIDIVVLTSENDSHCPAYRQLAAAANQSSGPAGATAMGPPAHHGTGGAAPNQNQVNRDRMESQRRKWRFHTGASAASCWVE